MQFQTSLFAVLALTSTTLACNVVTGVRLTAYGYPDASGIPAYKCNGAVPVGTTSSDRTQLGDGSPQKPYAAAAASNSVFGKCDLIYIPMLEKYFRVQDNCGACSSTALDLYIAQTNSDVGQTNCELAFGTFTYDGRSSHEVLVHPPYGNALNKDPLFDLKTKKCYNNPADGRVYPSRDVGYKCP